MPDLNCYLFPIKFMSWGQTPEQAWRDLDLKKAFQDFINETEPMDMPLDWKIIGIAKERR